MLRPPLLDSNPSIWVGYPRKIKLPVEVTISIPAIANSIVVSDLARQDPAARWPQAVGQPCGSVSGK